MGVSYEIRNFAETMTSRMRSFDEQLGTNNFITDTTVADAVGSMNRNMIRIKELLEEEGKDKTAAQVNAGKVIAKTLAVDMANLSMVLWSKL